MIERTQDTAPDRSPDAADAVEELGYRIELLQERDPRTVERVLARACSATLARAIYKAAQSEHPDRRITLSRGNTLLADTGAKDGARDS